MKSQFGENEENRENFQNFLSFLGLPNFFLVLNVPFSKNSWGAMLLLRSVEGLVFLFLSVYRRLRLEDLCRLDLLKKEALHNSREVLHQVGYHTSNPIYWVACIARTQ